MAYSKPRLNAQQWSKFKLNESSRLSNSVNQFMFEEKFDTWLDLLPLKNWQKMISNLTEWPEQLPFEWQDLLSPDAYEDIKNNPTITPRLIRESIVTPCLPSIVINQILSKPATICHIDQKQYRERYKKLKFMTKRALTLQIEHLFTNCGPEAFAHLTAGVDREMEFLNIQSPIILGTEYVSEDMSYLMRSYKKLLSGVTDKHPALRSKRRASMKLNNITLPSIDARVFLSKDISVLFLKGETYILHTEALLELHNKLTELNSVLHYAWFQSGSSMPAEHYQFVIKFLHHLTSTIKRYSSNNVISDQNKGFIYLKCIEGLGVAEIIRRSDAPLGWDNTLLQDTLWTSLYDDGIVKDQIFADSALNEIWSTASIPQLAEVLGLIKVCGHPSIEVERGVQELFTRTHAILEIDQDAVNRSIGWLIKDLCLNFYKKHRKLPILVEPLSMQPRTVQAVWNSRHSILDPAGRQIWNRVSIQDWSKVKLGKNFEFDIVDNQLEFIKDKALGITKSQVLKLWVLGPGEKMSLGLWEDRRALLNFLLSKDFNSSFLKYMEKFEYEDPWSNAVLEYMVIKLTPKELEEKPQGRMFGASPGNERMRRIYQEHKMMKYMDQYVPEQMLTPGELSMIKKLFSFRSISKLYPHHVAIQVSFDFSKWNNNMRSASIDVQAKRIADPLHGTNIFGRTMEFYEKSLVYYLDKTYKRKWRGQYGGIEGLNQPTWTYYFLGGLKDALSRIGEEYQITVKGDDVRAVILVNRDRINREGLDHVRDQIMTLLSDLCKGMGWQLNPQESFVSLSVICTSKQYQVNDTWLPASSKKMMKIESLANLIFPTFEDLVSNIFSTCHSACSQTTVVMPCYITAVYTACRLVLREFGGKFRDDDSYLLLLLWPQVLGGPGALPLQCFFIRGENDMLSVSVSLFRHIVQNGTDGEAKIAKYILSQTMKKNPDLSLLLADPYAIPIASPERPSAVLRNLLRESLKEMVVNQDIKKLLTKEAETHKEQYKSVLLSMEPYCAKLATMLWEVSPFYLIDEILGKFIQSSTVFALLSKGSKYTSYYLRGKAIRALHKVLQAAERRLLYWMNVVKGASKSSDTWLGVSHEIWLDNTVCTTEIVHRIRRSLWGRDIYGITYPSLSDQNQLFTVDDLMKVFPGQSFEGVHTVVEVHSDVAVFQTDYRSHHFAAAPGIIPWLGSTTAPKLKLPDVPINAQSNSMRKLMTLLTLLRASSHYSRTFELVTKEIAYAYTDVDLSKVLALTPDVGMGHIAHRAKIASFSMSTMPNVRPNVNQMVTVNNDYLRIVQQDSHDRSINYAARAFYLITLATFPLQFRELFPEGHCTHFKVLFHGHFNMADRTYVLCEYCCAVLDDIEVTFTHTLLPPMYLYRTLPHVGLSPADERVLENNIQSAVKNKIATVIAHERWDINRPDHVRRATHIVLNSLTCSFLDAFKLSTFHDFSYMPRGQLLEVLSLTLGLRDLSICTPSLNVLRAMLPRDLYLSVLNSVMCWYLEWMCEGMFLEPILPPLLSILQSHHNPLAGLFELFAEAGILGKIIAGCEEEGIVNSPLSFAAGSQTDGHIGVMSFLEVHESFFREWAQFGSKTHQIKLFVAMEDDDTIRKQIHKRALQVELLMVRRINVSLPIGSVMASVVRIYNKHAAYCRQHHIQGEEDVHIQLLKDHLSNPERRGHDERLYKLGLLYVIMHLDFCFEFGDWNDEQGLADYRMAATELPILVFSEDGLDTPEDIADIIPEGQYIRRSLSQKYGEIACKLLTNTVNEMMRDNDPRLMDQLGDGMIRAVDIVNTHLPHFNTYQYNIMTMEDAERVLKLKGVDPLLKLEEITDALDELDTGVDVDEIIALQVRQSYFASCQLQGHGIQHRHAIIGIEIQVHIPYHVPQLQAVIDALLTDDELHLLPMVYPDLSEMTRSRGYSNAAVVRFVNTYNQLGIHQVIEEHYTTSASIVLGDGTGSISKYLLENHPTMQVFMVSLARIPGTMRLPRDAAIHDLPYAFMIDPSSAQTVAARLHYQAFYPGNILDPVVQQTLKHEVQHAHVPVAMVVSDIEWGSGVDVVDYVRAVGEGVKLYLSYADHGCSGIFKIRLRQHPAIAWLLYYICATSEHFHICLPLSDRDNELDVYIFVQSPLMTFIADPDKDDILCGLSCPPLIPDLIAMILAPLRIWREKFLTFRLLGANMPRNLDALEKNHSLQRLPLMPLHIMLRYFKLPIPKDRIHHCAFINFLSLCAINHSNSILDSLAINTRITRRGNMFFRVSTKDHKVLAKGATAYINQLIIACSNRILGIVLTSMQLIFDGQWNVVYERIIRDTWLMLMRVCMNYPQHNLHMKYINGHWLLGASNLHIDLNHMTIKAISKSIRVCSWYIRTCNPRVFHHTRNGIPELNKLHLVNHGPCCQAAGNHNWNTVGEALWNTQAPPLLVNEVGMMVTWNPPAHLLNGLNIFYQYCHEQYQYGGLPGQAVEKLPDPQSPINGIYGHYDHFVELPDVNIDAVLMRYPNEIGEERPMVDEDFGILLNE